MNTNQKDLGIDPNNMTTNEIVDYFDRRIKTKLEEVRESSFWKTISDPHTDKSLLQGILKEIYADIISYQEDVVEAGMTMISQLPRTIEPSVIEDLMHHQCEEWDHGEMAVKDFISLGGTDAEARSRRMSPGAFAVAAAWRMLSYKRDAFAYLGAVYPFEAMTPFVTAEALKLMKRASVSDDALGFISFHSTADVEHASQLRDLMISICESHPSARESMCYGFEYFMGIYPIAMWQAACDRAILEFEMSNGNKAVTLSSPGKGE